MQNNLVDSTTLHAVDSLFRDGHRDPWAKELAGSLADLFIYSDSVRYPVPDRGATGPYDIADVDSLVRELARRDSDVLDRSTTQLETAIKTYLRLYNEEPRPFVWHKTADEILESLGRFCTRISDSGH